MPDCPHGENIFTSSIEYVASCLLVVPGKGPGLVQPGEEKASEEPSDFYGRMWKRQGQDVKLVDIPIRTYQ